LGAFTATLKSVIPSPPGQSPSLSSILSALISDLTGFFFLKEDTLLFSTIESSRVLPNSFSLFNLIAARIEPQAIS
jgi:hypothetical protein